MRNRGQSNQYFPLLQHPHGWVPGVAQRPAICQSPRAQSTQRGRIAPLLSRPSKILAKDAVDGRSRPRSQGRRSSDAPPFIHTMSWESGTARKWKILFRAGDSRHVLTMDSALRVERVRASRGESTSSRGLLRTSLHGDRGCAQKHGKSRTTTVKVLIRVIFCSFPCPPRRLTLSLYILSSSG